MSYDNQNLFARFVKFASKIEENEIKAVTASFSFVFILMSAYYLLRPVRDAMASNWTDAEVSWLWTSTFFLSAAAVAIYGFAVSRIRFRILVPSVYGFFAGTFVFFYLGTQYMTDVDLIDKAFYVWVSVFSLYHISVFWSLMADVYSKNQSKRLFGFIAAGASAGAIIGPSIPAFFASKLGNENLMLIASALLVLTIPVIIWIQRLKITDLHNERVHVDLSSQMAIGGNPFSGFTLFLKNPYLLGIGLFILLYTGIGSFIYFELKNLMAGIEDESVRAQYWSGMNLAVNTLSIVIAMFATGRIASRFGLAITLAMVPVLLVLGLLVVAVSPLLWVVIAIQIAFKGGNYAITRPGREMLFTDVNRETRFKSKPVIDIVVYRGGDMTWAWGFTALTQGFGLGLGAVAAVGAGIAAVWALVGIYLGRWYNRRSVADEVDTVNVEPVSSHS